MCASRRCFALPRSNAFDVNVCSAPNTGKQSSFPKTVYTQPKRMLQPPAWKCGCVGFLCIPEYIRSSWIQNWVGRALMHGFDMQIKSKRIKEPHGFVILYHSNVLTKRLYLLFCLFLRLKITQLLILWTQTHHQTSHKHLHVLCVSSDCGQLSIPTKYTKDVSFLTQFFWKQIHKCFVSAASYFRLHVHWKSRCCSVERLPLDTVYILSRLRVKSLSTPLIVCSSAAELFASLIFTSYRSKKRACLLHGSVGRRWICACAYKFVF